MSATFKDVVFSTSGPIELVWCEYRARFHTIVQVRYQVRAFEALNDEIGPNGQPIYRKGRSIEDSSWKRTPQRARQDVEDEVGAPLRKENIVYENAFSISIPIIDEEF
jgi:hypothetical protein